MWRANDLDEVAVSFHDHGESYDPKPITELPGKGEEPETRRPTGGLMFCRILDLIVALSVLVITLPVLVLISMIQQIDSPGPIIFAHQRIGRGGRSFRCLKLRTMCVDAEEVLARHLEGSPDARDEWARMHKLKKDPRITRLGFWLRKYSLDELPQLVNVIRGEMSIVGPRPIIAAEIPYYGRWFTDYCAVKPGLTGLWQVSGRNDTSYDERVALDRFYALNKSLWLDLSILVRTVPTVLAARGCY
jgi:lipopolysaccharide/colanic/teichoic acid biosynthesis glycosyltransferase